MSSFYFRYNPENLTTLESYVHLQVRLRKQYSVYLYEFFFVLLHLVEGAIYIVFQVDGNAYDMDANLAVLKL